MLPKGYRLKRRDFDLIYSDHIKGDQSKGNQSRASQSKDNQAINKSKKIYSTQYLAKYLRLRLLKLPSDQTATATEFFGDCDHSSQDLADSPERFDNQAQKQESKQAQLKIGIVISKKVAKRAVIRNRLRRQIRAILVLIMPLSQGLKGDQRDLAQSLSLIFTALPFTVQPNFVELKADLIQLLEDSNLISSP